MSSPHNKEFTTNTNFCNRYKKMLYCGGRWNRRIPLSTNEIQILRERIPDIACSLDATNRNTWMCEYVCALTWRHETLVTQGFLDKSWSNMFYVYCMFWPLRACGLLLKSVKSKDEKHCWCKGHHIYLSRINSVMSISWRDISLTVFIENAFSGCWCCSGCAKGTVSRFLLLLLFPLSQFLRTVSFCFIGCNKGLQRIQLKKLYFYKLY